MSTITKEQIEMYASAAVATQTFEMDKGKLICVEPEHMLELARIALASLEADEGWVACSERMPEGMTDVHISNGHDTGQGWWDGDIWQTQHDYYSVPGDVTHWMPLPAAPQQGG